MFIEPAWAAQFPELIVVQSTRLGGVSPAPYASLNLGWYTEDDAEHVKENRALVATALGVSEKAFAGGHQVHGNQVKTITEAASCTGYDAFVTNKLGVILTVTVADCVPVLIYDPEQKAWGAAHAGWRGTVGGVVTHTLSAMTKNYGTRPADCYAYIGACISRPNFEVSRDVALQFATHLVDGGFPNDKFRVDLKQANREQLLAGGVSSTQIEVTPYCTVTDNDRFFSYRNEGGKTGRMLGIIGRKA